MTSKELDLVVVKGDQIPYNVGAVPERYRCSGTEHGHLLGGGQEIARALGELAEENGLKPGRRIRVHVEVYPR